MVLVLFATLGHASENSYRLPNGTIPMHYILRLETAIDRNIFHYTGNVQISIFTLQPTYRIVLHSTHSKLRKVQLRDKNGQQVQVNGTKQEIDQQFLVIETATLLHPRNGMYTLEIDFTNSVDREEFNGFYKTSYQSTDGAVRYIGATHFAPIYARSAFPCFDEPHLKATFELHISCGLKYHVRSNTPARTVKLLPGGKQMYSFTTTPRMQTYLLAWLISDFVSERKPLDGSRITVATWGKPPSAHLLSHSLNVSVRYLRIMEDYFAERYSLPKIDNVAIPQQNKSWWDAMENWGLVTYQENAILFDPRTEGMEKRRNMVKLIAHEYTHQFFGNLLASAWWNYLWLKEGFARFYSYYLGDIVSNLLRITGDCRWPPVSNNVLRFQSYPEHNLRKRFITEVFYRELLLDSKANVPPMTYYVEKPKDIQNLYGHVAYAKAACVIRMMHYALGERIFHKGIRHYIQQNKRQGIVTENDLFDSLELAAKQADALPKHLTVHEVFRTWSHQAGYPVVTVRRDGDQYYLTQRRLGEQESVNSSWWIPITFSTANNATYATLPGFWMAPNVSVVSYTIPTAPQEVVVFNPRSTGFYRVAYDPATMRAIIHQLTNNRTAIVPTARARLIDDAFHLAHTREANFGTVLELLHYLRHEDDILPWTIAYENLRYLQSMLRTSEKASRLLQSFVEVIVTPLVSRYDVRQHSNGTSIEELQTIAIELENGGSNASQSILNITTQHANSTLNETAGCFFQLQSKELHRLIVGSKTSTRVLLESIKNALSQHPRYVCLCPRTIDQTLTQVLPAVNLLIVHPFLKF
uniref:Aminopeptidase n=1 Tax=Anopheles culicifacies TaxID=139723 RepID=A0A182M616_9DIPT